MIVIPIYALVAFTMIGALDPPAGSTVGEFLGKAGELGLAEAADAFMPAGAIVILIGGILSTISALNATTYSSTRVSYAMGRDRVMPDAFATVHDRFRTPHIALGATGVLMLFMVVFLPIEAVAAAADVMFLLLFLQVHYAVIQIRGEMGDRVRVRLHLMPWYPWVPVLGIILNASLAVFLVFYELTGWLVAIGWILVGVVVFVTYSGAGSNTRTSRSLLSRRREVYGRGAASWPRSEPSTMPMLFSPSPRRSPGTEEPRLWRSTLCGYRRSSRCQTVVATHGPPIP